MQECVDGIYFYIFCPNNPEKIFQQRQFISFDGKHRNGKKFHQTCAVEKQRIPITLAFLVDKEKYNRSQIEHFYNPIYYKGSLHLGKK